MWHKVSNLICLLITFIHGSIALIPEQCTKNVTRPGAVCCPHNPHNGLICGGPERGFCQEIYAKKEDIPSVFWQDDRLQWPLRYIKHACQCKNNYFGVSCEECWYGWTGPHCDKREHKIRKDIRHLSDHELHVFKDIVVRSQTWPSHYSLVDESRNSEIDPLKRPRFIPASIQYYITYLHAYGSRTTLYTNDKKCDEYGILNFNHDGTIFPTWHRYYNLIWERMLGKIAWKIHGIKDWTMPYWDWVGLKHCDICNDKYIGASGRRAQDGVRLSRGSAFHNLTSFCWEPEFGMSCFGCQAAGRVSKLRRLFTSNQFVTQKEMEFILNLPHYFKSGERDNPECESFHMALEGFCGPRETASDLLWGHNRLHNQIEGDMSAAATATNDPIFILHHAFVDKLFSMWYRKHHPKKEVFPNQGVRPGHARDDFMIGLFPLARNMDMFKDVTEFGYDYNEPNVAGIFAENHKGPIIAY